MMDFSKFEAVENSNTRKPGTKFTKVQQFDNLKYRKAKNKVTGEVEGKFFVSNVRFAELGLAADVTENADKTVTINSAGNGLRQFIQTVDGKTVGAVLGVVADKDAKILKVSKRGMKTKGFKSDKLEAALNDLKIIDATKEGVNQFIDLKLEAENVTISKVAVLKAFSMSVGAEKPKPVKATPLEEGIEAAKAEKAAASDGTIAPAPVAATAGGDDAWK